MINALNGFNQSFNYQDAFNKQPTTIENLDRVKNFSSNPRHQASIALWLLVK